MVGILGKSIKDVTAQASLLIYLFIDKIKIYEIPLRNWKQSVHLDGAPTDDLRFGFPHAVYILRDTVNRKHLAYLRSNGSYHQNQSRPHPVQKHSTSPLRDAAVYLPLHAWVFPTSLCHSQLSQSASAPKPEQATHPHVSHSSWGSFKSLETYEDVRIKN